MSNHFKVLEHDKEKFIVTSTSKAEALRVPLLLTLGGDIDEVNKNLNKMFPKLTWSKEPSGFKLPENYDSSELDKFLDEMDKLVEEVVQGENGSYVVAL